MLCPTFHSIDDCSCRPQRLTPAIPAPCLCGHSLQLTSMHCLPVHGHLLLLPAMTAPWLCVHTLRLGRTMRAVHALVHHVRGGWRMRGWRQEAAGRLADPPVTQCRLGSCDRVIVLYKRSAVTVRVRVCRSTAWTWNGCYCRGWKSAFRGEGTAVGSGLSCSGK